jgi:hypothetical protein
MWISVFKVCKKVCMSWNKRNNCCNLYIFRSARYGCPNIATSVHLYHISSHPWVISASTSRVAKILAVWESTKGLDESYLRCSRTENKGNAGDHAIGPFQPIKDDWDHRPCYRICSIDESVREICEEKCPPPNERPGRGSLNLAGRWDFSHEDQQFAAAQITVFS